MLTLSKKSEYALIAMCHLANDPDELASARDIAERHCVPLPLLMNVLKLLAAADLIHSTRGKHGGYQIAVDPADVSINELIEAVEGPVQLVPCAPGSGLPRERRCERVSVCAIRRPLHRVHEAFRAFLESVTVADLAFDGEPMRRKTVAAIRRVTA